FRGESLARAFNATNQAIDTSVAIALTPLTTASVIFTNERLRFDRAPERDSNIFRVMPTLTFSPLGVLNGSASFGYRKFTALDPVTPAFEGVVAQVGAGVTLWEHHRFETTVLRDLTYSYDRAATYYIQNSLSGSWNYAFGGRFDTQLGAGRNRMHYHQTSS